MYRKEKLANIYVKIYNKRPLTMDDLEFLSKYDPECFAKTCQNLAYNIPETKELMQQTKKTEENTQQPPAEMTEVPKYEKVVMQKENMELLLQNLQKMEAKEISVQEVKADKVKNLLGSLYMELLFPHNDKEQYFEMDKEEKEPMFNQKV